MAEIFAKPFKRLAFITLAFNSSIAGALWIDGDGHYALRGITETAPGFSKKTGNFQAIEQSFRLLGEARLNDTSSFFMELRLFDDQRRAYLGDTPAPEEHLDCERNVDRTNNADVSEIRETELPCKHQNTGEPGYRPYSPRIHQAFVRYGFDYCVVEAGRRPRNWGLGIFLNSGKNEFDSSESVFDGITCNINIQKSQTLGFAVGFDKLAETGAHLYVDDDQHFERRFGPTNLGDDLDQIFFAIEFDDRKVNAGANLTKNVGVYFAQVNGKSLKEGGSNTDIKFLDLYTGFFFSSLSIQNEVVFRMGKSADPAWQLYGGAALRDGEPATNKLQSIGLAGNLDWTISRSGSSIGPNEYNSGDISKHLLFLGYAYAPGDSDGYFGTETDDPQESETGQRLDAKRDNNASAMAFNRNYKPALILFNARPELDATRIDGVWNPSRLMNAALVTTGYRFESQKNGAFELKLIAANLLQTAPSEIKSYFTTSSAEGANNPSGQLDKSRPVGYFGKSLGFEIDLAYSYKLGREAELGVAGGAAMPGSAVKVEEGTDPVNNFLMQSWIAFKF